MESCEMNRMHARESFIIQEWYLVYYKTGNMILTLLLIGWQDLLTYVLWSYLQIHQTQIKRPY